MGTVQLKKKGTTEFAIIFVFLLVAALFLFTCQGVTDGISGLVSIWTVCAGSGLVLFGLCHAAGGLQSGICFIGYLLRCVCMLVDIYGRDYITLLHSGSDSETFALHASGLYEGWIDGNVSTKYPYAINWIYHVTGENRLLAQYANVIFWVLSAGILIRICQRFQVTESMGNMVCAVWSFLPTGILLSGILLRESAEMFFGMWSFEKFLQWMHEGKKRYCVEAFLYVLPAVILHSASVALWTVYVVVIMFWDTWTRRCRLQRKSLAVVLVLAAGLLAVIFFFRETAVWSLLFGKLGGDFSLYGITHRVFYAGGSDYLVNMDCQSWIQFVPYTLVRMFYFLFSPVPLEARGFGDIVMFLADGLPLAVIICYSLVKIRQRKEIRGYAGTALLGGCSFAGIFAWGVRNAGTALRHRYLAWSIFIIALCICCGNRKKDETEAC